MDQENNEEVKPVKLGICATVVLVIGLVIMVFIVVITIRGCSIQKVEKSSPTEQYSETYETEVVETMSKIETTPSEYIETKPISEVVVTTPPEASIPKKEGVSTTEQSASTNPESLNEVAEPALSEEFSAYGMVIGKHIYKRNTSYVYGVNLSIVINDKSVSAEYFCPRKTFDSLKSGDALNVVYQVDSNGCISIVTISFS